MWLLAAVPLGLFLLIIWAPVVSTSPTLDDEDRIRGWGTVIRELPATAFLLAVPVTGLLLAVRGGRRGAPEQARTAIWLHGAALFFALLVVMNGSAENIMTTRPSTVKWLLFPLQASLTAFAVVVARRRLSART
jgi:hypothetical protein